MCRSTKDDAMEYIVECSLATIDHVAGRNDRSSGELRRHINIARKGVDMLILCDIKPTLIRTKEVIEKFHGSVGAWAKQYDVKDKVHV